MLKGYFEDLGVKNTDELLKCMNIKSEEEFVQKLSQAILEEKNKFLPHNLFDYQEEVVHKMLTSRGILTAFSTGTGKTLTAAASAVSVHYLSKKFKKPLKILIVTPASLVENMKKEFSKLHYDFGNSLRIISSNTFSDLLKYEKIMRETGGKKPKYLDEKDLKIEYKKFLVAKYGDFRSNYKWTQKGFDSFRNKKLTEVDKMRKMIDSLKSKVEKHSSLRCDENTFLIVDEAHEFKTDYKFLFDNESLAAKMGKSGEETLSRSKMFTEECVLKVWKVLLMTATPFFNKWFDVMYLLAAIKGVKPDELLDHYKLKDSKYFINPVTREAINSPEYIYYEVPIFDDDYFKGLMRFKSVDPSDKRYPKKNPEMYIKIPMSNAQDYNNQLAEIEAKRKKTGGSEDELMGFMEKLQAKYAKNYPEKAAKIVEIANSGKYNKIIVYSRLTTPLKAVHEYVSKKVDFDIFMITGDTTAAKQRQEMLGTIQKSKKALVFMSDAGGIGLDFKEIEAVIILEPSINYSREDQVIGRAVRFLSHVNLPEHKQRVDIYKLIFTAPEGAIRKLSTADQHLSLNAIKKYAPVMDVEKYFRNLKD